VNTAENVALWNSRASLGEKAGTQDLILKELEQRVLLKHLGLVAYHKGVGRGLEVGCGTGDTARLAAGHFRAKAIVAIDSSPGMIDNANVAVALWPNLAFSVGDVMAPPSGPFDVVYSQRCLINLPNWDAQKQAIDAIAGVLVPGGRFLMCEHSADGLDYINQIRQSWRRPEIQKPWHNQYFRESDLATISSLTLVQCVHFSATYYFLSRILNDKLSEAEGKVPAYDAPINQLALRLPGECVDPRFAQARLWIWSKE
jgi:ubiquinone/menaquinone biosynthesis C-methylase UbiE